MNSTTDSQRARAELRQFSQAGTAWGAWLVYYLPLTTLAVYAWSRNEVNGMLMAWALMLALSVWQMVRGLRNNRALDRLLAQYEASSPLVPPADSSPGT